MRKKGPRIEKISLQETVALIIYEKSAGKSWDTINCTRRGRYRQMANAILMEVGKRRDEL